MKKTLLALILVFAMVFIPSTVLAKDNHNGRFSDITDCWAKDSIDRRARGDIFDRTGKFLPNKQITRMEFVLLLHDAMDININYLVAPDITDTYSDVKNTDKGASQLIDLVTAGIIDRKGKFGPNDKLTREELLHYIINALNYATDGNYPLIKMIPAPFKDDDKINPAYKNDIMVAQLLGIVKGGTGNMLHPKQHATRAEAVTFIDRMLSFVESLNPVKAEVTAEVKAVVVNGALEMSLKFTNSSDRDVLIKHPSSQKFDFIVYDAKGNNIYQYSANKRFSSALTETLIKAGDSVSFTDTLSKEGYNTIKAKASYVKGFVTGASENFDIAAEGYKASITAINAADVVVHALQADGSLKVSISLTNRSSKAIEIGHGAGQLFDYSVYDAKGNILYTWTEGKAFTMMYVYTTVKPGESVSFSDTLDKETYDSIKDKMSYVKGFVRGMSEDVDISSDGYKAMIEKAAGLTVSVEARIVNGALVMEMVLNNSSKRDIIISHTSSQSYDFKIFGDKGENLYTWSADKMFLQALTTTKIPAGGSMSYTETLEKDAFAAIKGRMSYLKGYITGTSESFTIDKDGYSGK